MIFVSRSEKGKRQSNQDRVGVFENKDTIFAILCDGMGGHSGGEIASSLAVNFLSREFVNNFNYKKDDVKLWFDINIDKLKRLMVREVKENDESLMEMGTTIT
ncbi:serine/threonine-protein phosphatase, partial [Mycoplasmopsis pullorum]